MIETQSLIQSMMESLQFFLSCLNDGADAASETSLLDLLAQLQQELNRFESEISVKAATLDLHFDSLPPVSHYLRKFKNRLILHFKNSDSAVAESMIRCATQCIITITRTKHDVKSVDPNTEQLFQRLHCCLNMSLRYFRAYL